MTKTTTDLHRRSDVSFGSKADSEAGTANVTVTRIALRFVAD